MTTPAKLKEPKKPDTISLDLEADPMESLAEEKEPTIAVLKASIAVPFQLEEMVRQLDISNKLKIISILYQNSEKKTSIIEKMCQEYEIELPEG